MCEVIVQHVQMTRNGLRNVHIISTGAITPRSEQSDTQTSPKREQLALTNISSTSLFYAYAKNINDDLSHRYLIVFANRAIADEWWRAVSSSSNKLWSETVKRVTPHLYTHDPNLAIILFSITDSTAAKQFLGKVIFTLLNDRDGRVFDVIPPGPEITDHISNRWYYIRSKGEHSVYWYCNKDNVIVASNTKSTRFLVRATDHSLDNKVMINSDSIKLSLAAGKLSISVAEAGNLKAIVKAETFQFEGFLNGYSINGTSGLHVHGLPENAIMKANDNSGEEWELTTNGRVSDEEGASKRVA